MASSIRHRKRTGQEDRQAIEWLAAAAESGHRGAMVDLGVVYLQGIKRIGLERDPYRAKLLFEQALRDREDTVYEQQTGNGRSWKYNVESVNRWLARIPEPVMRLNLEGLEAETRRQTIEQWYTGEQQRLRAQTRRPGTRRRSCCSNSSSMRSSSSEACCQATTRLRRPPNRPIEIRVRIHCL